MQFFKLGLFFLFSSVLLAVLSPGTVQRKAACINKSHLLLSQPHLPTHSTLWGLSVALWLQ